MLQERIIRQQYRPVVYLAAVGELEGIDLSERREDQVPIAVDGAVGHSGEQLAHGGDRSMALVDEHQATVALLDEAVGGDVVPGGSREDELVGTSFHTATVVGSERQLAGSATCGDTLESNHEGCAVLVETADFRGEGTRRTV